MASAALCQIEAEIKKTMVKGYMYILECSDGTYYTGSTKDLKIRLEQHQNGEGAITIRQKDYRLFYYTMRNFRELMRLFIGRNK